jgi:hypothetical protein
MNPAEKRRQRARILVVRTGGFAGLKRSWAVEPSDDVDEWMSLVDACPWDAVGTDPASRDRFVWRIEAVLPPERRTASVPDRELTGPWQVLVQRVREAG